ncbi:MAG TPA: MFS transporter [Xanthobacteraceae bacterium]|nr:MFS transporter [Xanthobacteraceae bacterium]
MTADGTAPLQLLHHRAFVRFLYVRIAASIALQVQAVAVGWQMYAMTRSPFQLGLVGLVQFVPAIGLFLATGHAADRYDRRRNTFLAQLVEAGGVAVLAVATASGRLTPALLLVMAFIIGTGRAFEQPSLQSALPNIVPASALPRAIAASTSAAQIAIVAGPALGGVLIAVSPTLVFAICAVLWLSAGVVMLGTAMARTTKPREPVDLKRLFSGLAFIGRHKVVLGAILLDLFAVLLGNATGLLPIFARDIFMSGPLSFGALRAAPAAGALLTALTLARWPIARRVGRIMFVAVAVFGTGTILLALSPTLLFAMGAMFIVGAADTVSVVIRQSLLLLHTPDEMRGRVFAVGSMFTGTSNQLGDFRAGAAAALVGTIPAVLIGGFSTLVVVLVSTQLFGELYQADRYEPAKAPVGP